MSTTAAETPNRSLKGDRPRIEPHTVVAVADLEPVIEEGTRRTGSPQSFGRAIQRFCNRYSDGDHAAKRLRTMKSGTVLSVPTTLADAICIAAGQNISQLPIAVIPGSAGAATLMVNVEADRNGETPLSKANAKERHALARQLLSFANGYIAGVSSDATVDELIAKRERERDGEAA